MQVSLNNIDKKEQPQKEQIPMVNMRQIIILIFVGVVSNQL